MKGGKIDHEQIGFLTNIERSNRLGLAERARTSGGREMERFPDAQRCDIRLIKRAQFLDFNGRTHDLPHVQFGSGGHVRPEADWNAGSAETIQFHRATAEVEIRGWTVRDG